MGAEARRRIPSIDALLRSEPGRRASSSFGRALVKAEIARALAEARAAAARGTEPPSDDELLARALGRVADVAGGLTRVVNATGVVLHTGLGRAALPEDAARAAASAAVAYTDLEIDRATGRRGRRTTRAETLIRAVTGAEDALVVNNGAAGVLLMLAALARGKQVLVSRGELIEIGGEFRIPDIMAASGAKLVEVGTTNRTSARDYRAGLTDRTALVLKVHPSNYRVVGFTAGPTARELADIASAAGVPFAFDLGSGLLERPRGFPADEPTPRDALDAGADLVVFSGDKLLGGPQAGIVLGRADLVERLRRNPIARAVRVDAMQVAALERVLMAYASGDRAELPMWRMLTERPDDVRHRAELLAKALERPEVTVVPCVSTVGGGSMPGHEIASFGVEIQDAHPSGLAARLRTGAPPVLCRVTDGGVLFDVRTVGDDEIADLARAIGHALAGG